MKLPIFLFIASLPCFSSDIHKNIQDEFNELENYEIKITTLKKQPKPVLKRQSKKIDLEELFFSQKGKKKKVIQDEFTTGQAGTVRRIRGR